MATYTVMTTTRQETLLAARAASQGVPAGAEMTAWIQAALDGLLAQYCDNQATTTAILAGLATKGAIR